METKVCTCCGKEKPVSEFKRIGRRGGGYSQLSICQSCMAQKIKDGWERRKAAQEKKTVDALEQARKARLSEFTPRELMEELATRGYVGTLRYTVVKEIDITKF